MVSSGLVESLLPHVTTVVGLPSQKLSVGVGFVGLLASASRFSLPQVMTVEGGPSSMVSSGFVESLFPQPTWDEGGPREMSSAGRLVSRLSLPQMMTVLGGPREMSSCGVTAPCTYIE